MLPHAVKRRSWVAFSVCVLGLLSGCAQVPRQAFNAAASSHIKTVVVAHNENHSEYPAQVLGHPGLSFGLVGALVAAADTQSKTTKLTAAIDPKETRLQERFAERLAERLKDAGYQVTRVTLPKDVKDEQAIAFAKQSGASDAVLVVNLYGGYWAAGPSTDYFPRVAATVKKVEAQTSKTLYEDSVSYGYVLPQAQSVHLASDASYRFPTIDALVADPAKTREGLYVGVDAVATQIAADLKKP